jgi:hypothetical protein
MSFCNDPLEIYTEGLWPPKDSWTLIMDFSMLSSKKQGRMVIEEPWLDAFSVNMHLRVLHTMAEGREAIDLH